MLVLLALGVLYRARAASKQENSLVGWFPGGGSGSSGGGGDGAEVKRGTVDRRAKYFSASIYIESMWRAERSGFERRCRSKGRKRTVTTK